MKITILGAGAYALALSEMFLKNNCQITLWTKILEEKEMIERERYNKKVFPNYKIDEKINVTTDMEEAIKNANVIVIAVPVKFVESTVMLLSKYYQSNQHICIASKGIEQENCLFINEIVNKYIETENLCVISGGSFAVDIISLVPVGLTLASKCSHTVEIMKKTLENDYLKLEVSNDLMGVEMYGAIKNIIAIGSGIIDGMNYPESTKSMFLTKALNDIMNLICFLGGDMKTVLTYAGIGDYILTCNSSKSRNYSFGKIIGERTDLKAIEKYINETTIEGLYTLKSVYDLLAKNNKNFPIIDILYDIVYNHKDIELMNEYLSK